MNAPFSAEDRSRAVAWDPKRQAIEPGQDVCRFVILALPGFSQLSLSAFVDPLRYANLVCGRSFFQWTIMSEDGKLVECASGFTLSASGDFASAGRRVIASNRPDMVVVCAGERVEKRSSASLINILRLCRRHGVPIAALGTATWLLAESGILDDTRCTIHWDKRAALSEMFGRLRVTDQLFVRESSFVTCAGEFASFDLVMDLITEHLGREAALAVCRHTTAGHWRAASETQCTADGNEGGICKPLAEVIRIMEEHIEDPLPLRDIAKCVGRSQRQIERLFRRSASSSPMRYYLDLRLGRARRLIEQTELPVVEIAIACGFASASHFSKCFRQAFGINPRAYRG
ncbi:MULTISPECIES: GlxA family transcriptional regulator [unclassified Mesorhizobium]|uniref:GlxA family transcriptional regulator n=1 Tax=unclassified Mesorhizobium TaxID=325217 RepID=UPI001092164F|nr:MULTISPECIES: GlxA family transcriptional regulator [unclassified Mesorhizobium]TGQ28201.1 GlxA family transcriptional regulator [Mesorhizobium sp. M4B.F.Ca.ET.214.01.1.1]TGQ55381.1 GlxA family transcriptional regulator [Mesorhizobium sp. M4B.F.Ca.ET.211.01.1.1]TGU28735.1 GlxA family transcriptional regulator [Mesorhizobium sp. M4B.F.Ca.ET.150.01.1.1]TIX09317.1 MAG: GlxA family transcriptional regulator [Mesorhizobium sp.]